ncbi:hypothetical protein ITI46_11785 [Streptomyces oryzae]|uniref:Uncharacterized protein n=1 Tax=Streptomyces oryzae TaxID=1434886 RepID=A0ABS3XAC6_9ACTN|nr:hypothetical protein [Streptomyces oryzae]MBO8192341.1 hypothetical protein [Streptomyces oryzae]
MTISEQYALDVWRLRSQEQPPPPAPGTHEAKLFRAWWVARKEAREELGRPVRSTAPRTLRRRARRA